MRTIGSTCQADLARRCSTTELHPRFEREEIMSSGRRDATFNCSAKWNIRIIESKQDIKRIPCSENRYEEINDCRYLLDCASHGLVRADPVAVADAFSASNSFSYRQHLPIGSRRQDPREAGEKVSRPTRHHD